MLLLLGWPWLVYLLWPTWGVAIALMLALVWGVLVFVVGQTLVSGISLLGGWLLFSALLLVFYLYVPRTFSALLLQMNLGIACLGSWIAQSYLIMISAEQQRPPGAERGLTAALFNLSVGLVAMVTVAILTNVVLAAGSRAQRTRARHDSKSPDTDAADVEIVRRCPACNASCDEVASFCPACGVGLRVYEVG